MMKVAKCGGAIRPRAPAWRSAVPIGHHRQIDQALDRAPIEVLPDCRVFGLDLLQVGVPAVNAEQLEARERALDGCGFSDFTM